MQTGKHFSFDSVLMHVQLNLFDTEQIWRASKMPPSTDSLQQAVNLAF
jgi:hypothetical protein